MLGGMARIISGIIGLALALLTGSLWLVGVSTVPDDFPAILRVLQEPILDWPSVWIVSFSSLLMIVSAWPLLERWSPIQRLLGTRKPRIFLEGYDVRQTPIHMQQGNQVIRVGTPYFAHAFFANSPDDTTEESTARSVGARVTFWDKKRRDRLFPAMVARWSDTPEVSQVGGIRRNVHHQVDIEPNGIPRPIDIILKYPDEDVCYGYNNESARDYLPHWRDPQKMVPKGVYLVQVQLQGIGVRRKDFWFLLT